MPDHRSKLAVSLLLLGCVGCGQRVEVRWEVTFDGVDGSLLALVVQRREADCEGAIVAQWAQGAMAPAREAVVQTGEYAFEVLAVDAQCRVVGRGCTPVRIEPGASPFVVEVRAVAPMPCGGGGDCPVPACRAEAGPEAGASPEAGLDAAGLDAGTPATADADLDAFDRCAVCAASGGECCGLDCCLAGRVCCPQGVCASSDQMCPMKR
ncbi:MAG: hypothetical protein ACK6CU_25420 [Deltaproteobacteria bacterium]